MMDSPGLDKGRFGGRFNINILGVESTPKLNLPLTTEKPLVLPHFPEFRHNSVRKASLALKSSRTMDTPSSPSAKSPIPTLGLFPVQNDTFSNAAKSFGRVGIPSFIVPDKASKFLKSPRDTQRQSLPHTIQKNLEAMENEDDDKKNQKEEVEEVPVQKPPVNQPSHKAIIFRKIKTGRISLEAVEEAILLELAIDALRKVPEHRGSTEVAILFKVMGHLEFFKDHDQRTIESFLKVMHHVSLKAGEVIYKLDDIAGNYWVNLTGAVNIFEYNEKIIGQTEKGKNIIQKEFKQIRQAHAVSGFGELVPAAKALRNHTVVCIEDCEFAVLEKGPYKEVLNEKSTRVLSEKIDFLASIPLFKGWTPRAIKDLFFQLPVATYKRGNVLYSQEDEPDKMYIVRKGEFKKLKEIEIGSDLNVSRDVNRLIRKEDKLKKVIEMCLIGEKEIFGEVELFNSNKRQYKVVCESLEAEVFEISKGVFAKILKQSQAKEWLETYGKAKEKHFEERIKSVKEATVKHKHLLLSFNKQNQIPSTPNTSQRPSINRQNSAAHIPHAIENPLSNFSERGSVMTPQPSERRLSKMATAPLGDLDELKLRETKSEAQSKRSQLILLLGSQNLQNSQSIQNSPRGEAITPKTKDSLQRILNHTKPHTSRSSYYSPRSVRGTPNIEEIGNNGALAINSERMMNKKGSVGMIEDKPTIFKKMHDRMFSFSGQEILKTLGNNDTNNEKLEKADSKKEPGKFKKEKLKSLDGPIRLLTIEDAQDRTLLTRSAAFTRFQVDDEMSKKNKDTIFASTQDGFGITIYNKAITEMTTPRVKPGKETVRMKETEEAKEKGFRRINFELQKQKVKDMLETKAGKEYRRFFYSLEGRDKMTKKPEMGIKLTAGGVKEENMVKKEVNKQKKNIKLEMKLSEMTKMEQRKLQVKSHFDVNGRGMNEKEREY